MRYKGILMDADDTLFDFRAANRRAVGLMLSEIGYDDPQGYEQYEVINHACWDALERGEMTQAELQDARWARFFERYGIARDAKWAGARFVELLGMQSMLLPHAEAVVRQIAAERPVWILTNGITRVQESRLEHSPLAGLVAGVVISQEVGVSKPMPEIFDIALDRMGLSRGEALMIGDGVTSDVRGANNAGIDVCWYNPRHKALPEGMHAEYEIDDIRDCVRIALQD